MELREYKEKDANEIIKWIKSERDLILWSADVYNKYPIATSDINNFYKKSMSNSKFYPMNLVDNKKIVGNIHNHFMEFFRHCHKNA